MRSGGPPRILDDGGQLGRWLIFCVSDGEEGYVREEGFARREQWEHAGAW